MRIGLWASIVVAAVAAIGATGCGATEEGGGAAKKKIVAFTPARAERYVNGLIDGLTRSADAAGYKITIIENKFDQAQEDQQVQQLSIALKPDMWIWWPSDLKAGLGSLNALHDSGVPVLQINQLPPEDTRKYVIGYAGPNDALRACNAGKMLVEAQKKLLAEGKKLSSPKGNVIVASYPVSYGGYPLSIAAFKKCIQGSGLQIIGESNEGFGSDNGFKGVAALIPKVKAKGIDFIYGMDDAILQGAIAALRDAGYKTTVPDQFKTGEVIAVGTVCNGTRQLIDSGQQFGTTLQSPLFEGQLAIQVAKEYFDTGKVKEFLNFTPNPAVTYNKWQQTSVKLPDGKTYPMDKLCTWS